MNHRITLLLVTAALSGGLVAQTTFNTGPSGYDALEGNTNNTIPWWSQSGTYQQIHDASDMQTVLGGPVALIQSIGFRKDGALSTSVLGRSLDIQISLGETTITAVGATSTFATNLGPTPQVVLPYTNVNLPTLTNASLPNPMGWHFPFQTAFLYTGTGNLCYEIRFTNNTVITSAPLDAASRSNSITNPLLGTGCIASGQTLASTIDTKSLSMSTGAWRNRLARGPASAPAVQLIGFAASLVPLPGFCADLQFLPVTSLSGTTNATGQWDSTLTFGSLVDFPQVDILTQFAWVDVNLPNPIGLSDASWFSLTLESVRHVSRIYNAPSSGGLGFEAATAAAGSGLRYGLVTYFEH
ncbi:MAG: hypothetical protein U1F36_19770 [Planctomycetota bacterium]